MSWANPIGYSLFPTYSLLKKIKLEAHSCFWEVQLHKHKYNERMQIIDQGEEL